MSVATSTENITPIAEGQILPDGPLLTMDGQTTTLYDCIQQQAAILIFYRGSW